MFKTFDPNKTIRHVSYRQMRAQREREKKLSDRFFGALAILSILAIAAIAFAQMVAR